MASFFTLLVVGAMIMVVFIIGILSAVALIGAVATATAYCLGKS